MTNETETIAGLQAQIEDMAGHLRHKGLIPTPARKRKVLSIEERRARIAADKEREKRWRDGTASLQERIAKAQKAYDQGRAQAVAAHEELESLRAEQVRLTADHVEKRDAVWAELHEGRSEAVIAATRTLDAEDARCFILVPRGAGNYPAQASRDARLEALRQLRQEVETSWPRLEDTDDELVARFNAALAKIPAIQVAA